jgi:hypothetical protein
VQQHAIDIQHAVEEEHPSACRLGVVVAKGVALQDDF